MAFQATQQGETYLSKLGWSTRTYTLGLGLYTNNYEVVESDTLSALTELSGSGYARKPLTAANWVITEGNPSEAAYPTLTWTFDSNNAADVYGYFLYIVDASVTYLIGAEKFSDGPYQINTNGDKILVTFKIQIRDPFDLLGSGSKNPNSGEATLLKQLTVKTPGGGAYWFEYFTNDFTPSDTSVKADFTALVQSQQILYCELVSYDNMTLTYSADGKAEQAANAIREYTSAGFTGNVYGWYIHDGVTVVAAERFASPVAITRVGDKIRARPVLFVCDASDLD